MLSLDINNSLLLQNFQESYNNTPTDHLLDTHILPNLNIKGKISIASHYKMSLFLQEGIANSLLACREKKYKLPFYKHYCYHPSILLRCQQVQDDIIFYLKDNGIGIYASGTDFKRNVLKSPNRGLGEQTMEQVAKNYRRISTTNGSIIRGRIGTQDTSFKLSTTTPYPEHL